MAGKLKEKVYRCTYPNCRRPTLELVQIFEHAAWYHCRVPKEEGCFEYKCNDVKCGGYFVSNFFAQNHTITSPGHQVVQLSNSRPRFEEAWQQTNDIVNHYIVHKDLINNSSYPPVVPLPGRAEDRYLANSPACPRHFNGNVTPSREDRSPIGFYSPAYARYWNDEDVTSIYGERTPTRERTPHRERTPVRDLMSIPTLPPFSEHQPSSIMSTPPCNAGFSFNRRHDAGSISQQEQTNQFLSDVQNDVYNNSPPRAERTNDEEYTPHSPRILPSQLILGPSRDDRKRPTAPGLACFEITRTERTKPSAPKSKEPIASSPIKFSSAAKSAETSPTDRTQKKGSRLEKVSAAIEDLKCARAINRYGGGSVVPRVITIDPVPLPPENEVRRPDRRSTPGSREGTPIRSRRTGTPTKSPERTRSRSRVGTPVRSRAGTPVSRERRPSYSREAEPSGSGKATTSVISKAETRPRGRPPSGSRKAEPSGSRRATTLSAVVCREGTPSSEDTPLYSRYGPTSYHKAADHLMTSAESQLPSVNFQHATSNILSNKEKNSSVKIGDAKRNNRMLLCDALNMIKRVPQEEERLTKSVGIKQEPPTNEDNYIADRRTSRGPRISYKEINICPEVRKRKRILSSSESEEEIKPTVSSKKAAKR